jgi:tetratricopeptide (TPR) repeat protein
LLKQAWQSYRAADFPRAEGMVSRALARNSFDPAVHYAAGVIYRASQRWTLAQDAFWAAIQYGGQPAPAFAQLGEISIRQKQYQEAVGLLRRALSYDSNDALALTDLAVALRLGGKLPEASEALKQALQIMPLLPYARAEQWRLAQASLPPARDSSMAGPMQAGLQLARPDLQDFLDVAAWYFNLDDLGSAHYVLRAALGKSPRASISPIFYYYLAAIERRWQQAGEADKSLAAAAQAPYEKVFPNRLTDARVLEEALQQSPADPHAQYFLGNFLFAHGRYDDAARLWSLALGEGFEYSVLMRNLGLYAWRVKKDLPGAAGFYESAIRLAPADCRLYVDLDEIYFRQDKRAAREKLLAAAPEAVRDRDTVLVRMALLETQEGHYDRALALLMNHRFKPWEGGEIVREMFVLANVQMGRQALESNQFSEAEKAFRQALQFPANLRVGKPNKPHDEEALYWLGEALAAQAKAEAARDAWRAAAEEGSTGPATSRLYRGLALRRLGETQEADKLLSALTQAAGEEKATPEAYYTTGLLALFENHRDEAKNYLHRALEADPSLWQAQIELDRAAR